MLRIAIFLTIVAWAGCSWTPERLNPYDPASENYVKPAQPNRPPVIDTLIVNTECINLPVDDNCGIIIKAVITDLDSNVRLNEVIATINGNLFGQLSYDAPHRIWSLSRQETELDSAAERFVGGIVQVTAVDDSGATGQRSLLFPPLFIDYPSIYWPKDFDCVCPDYPNFSWYRWNGQGHARDYEIRFFFGNTVYVPHLTIPHISIADTFVTGPTTFEPTDGNELVFYGWRIFIYDELGNSAGSEAKTFKYYVVCNDSCQGP